VILADLSTLDLGKFPPPTLVVPVGAVEQHGPHLPLSTDGRVATAVATRLEEHDPTLVLAPALPYGASGEHEGFAGTVSIGHEALRSVLVELGRSACRWAGRLLFVNGHGGNVPTLAEAVGLLRYEGRDAAWVPCAVPGDAHAGRTETSLMLALEPGLVGPAREPGATAPLAELLPALREHGVAGVSPNGILGDPRGAGAEEGRRLLDAMVAGVAAAVTAWAPDPRTGRLIRPQ
jgi:mycofactocin precursor peptide peptidase